MLQMNYYTLTDISKRQQPEMNLFCVKGSSSNYWSDGDTAQRCSGPLVSWVYVMHMVSCKRKYCGRLEIIELKQMNLEIVINYPSSFVFDSERVLTFKDALCLITQKNMKQVDSLSCLYIWNVSKASGSLNPSTSGAFRLLCVPLCGRQAMIALGYATTVCSQIGLH